MKIKIKYEIKSKRQKFLYTNSHGLYLIYRIYSIKRYITVRYELLKVLL